MMRDIITKIDMVRDWFKEQTGGEYEVTNQAAYVLIENLEMVVKNGKK